MPTPTRLMLGGMPNYVVDPYTVITVGGSAAADMPATNLANDEPSLPCRITLLDPSQTTFKFRFYDIGEYAKTRTINIISLIGSTLTRFGKVRMVGMLTDDLPNPTTPYNQRLMPTGTVSSLNLAAFGGGAADHTSIDEDPVIPDAQYIGSATNPDDVWRINVSFATPAATLRTGADLQCFVVWCKQLDAGSFSQVEVWLYEAGVEVLSLGVRQVDQTAGQYLIFPWNASLLSAASGADVELRFRAGTGTVGAQGIQLGSICWDVMSTATSAPDWDSGWLSPDHISDDDEWAHMPEWLSGEVPTWYFTKLISDGSGAAEYNGARFFQTVRIEVRDDQTLNASPTSAPVVSPAGYFDLGVVMATWANEFSANIAPGPLLKVVDPSQKLRTPGGQQYGSIALASYREMDFKLDEITEDEAWSLFDRLDWRRGITRPVFVMAFPDATNVHKKRHTTLYGTARELSAIEVKMLWDGPDGTLVQLAGRAFSVEEKL